MGQERIRSDTQIREKTRDIFFNSYITGTLVSNQFWVFVAPFDLTLIEVQACGSNTNNAQLKAGNSLNDAAYLEYFDIGDSSVPTRKNLGSDFVGGNFPTIPSGTTVNFTLDYDGAGGTAASFVSLLAVFQEG